MAKNTAIEWADHTLNFWTGCRHVSPACDGCYAEEWAKRAGRDFNERRQTRQATRNEAFRYQADAADFYAKHRRCQLVFVNSLSDFFDNEAEQAWRDDAYDTFRRCPRVIFLLLTKRIGNAVKMLPKDWGDGWPNVWIGSTVVTQSEAARDIPKLLRTPAKVRFLSCEPMVEVLFLRSLSLNERVRLDALGGQVRVQAVPDSARAALRAGYDDFPIMDGLLGKRVDWVIAGGESGGKARPANVRWFRELREDCAATGVPFFFKQWGEWAPPEQLDAAKREPLVARHDYIEDSYVMRFGKKRTGSLLDGVEHKAWPDACRG